VSRSCDVVPGKVEARREGGSSKGLGINPKRKLLPISRIFCLYEYTSTYLIPPVSWLLKSNDKAQNKKLFSTMPAHSFFETTIPCDRATDHHGGQARRATPHLGLTPRGARGRPRDATVEQPHWRRKAKQQRQAPQGHYRHQSQRCRDHRTSACVTVCFQALGGWVLATLGCAGTGARSHQHVLAPSPGG